MLNALAGIFPIDQPGVGALRYHLRGIGVATGIQNRLRLTYIFESWCAEL
jgi:hypothetical protein